jgi:hypothetical protein
MPDLIEHLNEMSPERRSYTLGTLPEHLEDSGAASKLHALLRERTCTENLAYEHPQGRGRLMKLLSPRRQVIRYRCENFWYESHEREGSTATFIADIARGWRLAESASVAEIESGNTSPSIALEVRYALISSSINNIGANIPPVVLSRLVETGVWTETQGLTYADRIPDLTRRSEALAAIARNLAGDAKELTLGRALDAALTIKDEGARSAALASLSPSLSHPLLRRAATIAKAIGIDAYRVRALTCIGLHLSEPLRSEILGKAWDSAQGLRNEQDKYKAQLTLLPHRPEAETQGVLDHILDEVAASPEAYWRGDVLEAAARHLSEPQTVRALSIAREIREEPQRTTALLALAAQAAKLGRGDEALRLVKEAISAPGGGGRAVALSLVSLAPHLGEEQLRQAARIMLKLYVREDRAEAIAGMSPHLPDVLFRRALANAKAMRHEEHLGAALVGLIPRLPRAEGEELLQRVVTGAIQRPIPRAALIELTSKLAAHLPADLLRLATAEITKLADAVQLVKTIAMMTEYQSSPLKSEDTQRALDYAGTITNQRERAEAFASLTQQVAQTGGVEEALVIVQQIEEPDWCAKALVSIATRLPEGRKVEVLTETLTQWAKELNTSADALLPSALEQLAPLFDASLWLRAVEVARKKTWESCRAGMLASLARHAASLPMFEHITADAARIRDERARATFITGVAEGLARLGKQAEALAIARAVPNTLERLTAFEKIAPHLSEPRLRELLTLTEEFTFEGSRWSIYAVIAPRFAELGNLEAALQVMLAIEGYQRRALTAARVAAYAPTRRNDLTEHAMAIVRNAQRELEESEDWWQAEALSRITPYLTGNALDEAFKMALEITDLNARAGPLSELSLRLTESPSRQVQQLWSHAIHRSATRSRPNLLSDLRALSPIINKLGGPEVVREITSDIYDIGQCWPA